MAYKCHSLWFIATLSLLYVLAVGAESGPGVEDKLNKELQRVWTVVQQLYAKDNEMNRQMKHQASEVNGLRKLVDDLRANQTKIQQRLADQVTVSKEKCQEKNLKSTQETLVNRNSTDKDCADLYKNGVTGSGVYTINPIVGVGGMEVYCDMVTNGGGWTVFQRRQDGSIDFYRDWTDYKVGFGVLAGEFWLGNDKIHRLTQQGSYRLRIDLEASQNSKAYAVYDPFSVASEEMKFKMTIGSYFGTAGDSLRRQNGQAFSTRDSDNDFDMWRHCAVDFHGAWWYKDCHDSNLNGDYGNNNFGEGINWKKFKGHKYSLGRTSMMIRPIGFKSEQKDCADLYNNGVTSSGVYTINPIDGLGTIKVYCDMVTDGGGWTVMLLRLTTVEPLAPRTGITTSGTVIVLHSGEADGGTNIVTKPT